MDLLTRLVEQAKKPKGKVGSIMLSIMNSAHNGLNKWAFDHVNIKDGTVILDIGTGGGNTIHTLSILNKTGKLYGIDHSEQAVKESIKKNKTAVEKGRIEIQQASVSNIPFEDNFFDLITAFQTHYFWPDIENDIKEVFRVLKPNGKLLIVSEYSKVHYHMENYKSDREMDQLLSAIGFRRGKFYKEAQQKWLCIEGVK